MIASITLRTSGRACSATLPMVRKDVDRGRGVRPGGGDHDGRGVVDLLPDDAARILHQVDHDVLAQEVGRTLGGVAILVL
jgi:hypothetical protein